MKKEIQLYHLIQSLTTSEKKNVRLNLLKNRTSKKNKNILLFDSLAEQKKYDEHQTAIAYAEANYPAKYLAADRNVLYDLVLSHLNQFHQKKSARIELSQIYQSVINLTEKKLFQQALKQVAKGLEQSEKYEDFGTAIKLLDIQKYIYKQTNQLDEAIAAIDRQEYYWEQQRTVNQYIKLHYQSIKLRTQLGKARSEGELSVFKDFLKQDLLVDIQGAELFQVQFHCLEIYANYYFVCNDKMKELECNQALGALIKKYHWFDENEPLVYLAVQTRIFAIKKMLFPSDFLKNIAAYRALSAGFSKQKKQAEATIFIFSHNYELDYYLQHKYWEKGLALLPTMQAGLKKHYKQISDAFLLTAYYRMACIYFYNQLYEDALKSIDNVLGFNANFRPEVYGFSLLIKAIIHYQLDNIRLLPHLIQATEYHMRSRNRLYQTEKITLRFLKKLARAPQDSIPIFQAYQSAILKVMEEDVKEKLSLEIFDFLAWIDFR